MNEESARQTGAAPALYVLAIVAPPFATWIVTKNWRSVGACLLWSLAFGIGSPIYALLKVRKLSHPWGWSVASLPERLTFVAGFAVFALLFLLAFLPEEEGSALAAESSPATAADVAAAGASPVETAAPEATSRPAGTPTATSTPTPTPSPTPQPPSWPRVELNQDTVLVALADTGGIARSEDLGRPRSIDVSAGAGAVVLHYYAEDAMGETDLLTIGAQTAFSAFRVLFEHADIETVRVTLLADWIDQLGNTNSEDTTSSLFTRATADQVNWDGLQDRVYADNKLLFCVSDERYIHPAIVARLEDLGCLAR